MSHQVVMIHGGHAFDKHEDFLRRLRDKKVTADDFKIKNGWKENMQSDLGAQFEVFNPRMPNGQNAYYVEWKIWFEKLTSFLDDSVILIGHSLGGLFLIRYLSENIFPKNIKALFIVAAPYEGKNNKHIHNENFIFNKSLEKVQSQAKVMFMYHSKDDPIVPFSDFEKFQQKLPNAIFLPFETEGHFNKIEVPGLVEKIRELHKSYT